VIGKIPIRRNMERRIKLISAFYLYSTFFSDRSLSPSLFFWNSFVYRGLWVLEALPKQQKKEGRGGEDVVGYGGFLRNLRERKGEKDEAGKKEGEALHYFFQIFFGLLLFVRAW
jgi:hypothetical protein